MDSITVVMDALSKSYASVGKPQTVLVGLSGGADSVALLAALCDMRMEQQFNLYAVHVNHGLRENANDDEAYCMALCDKLDVPLAVKRVQVPRGGSVEAIAREKRYAAFRQAADETNADILALAHHMDDQAETVVMHLMYGAGATGLGGMKEINRDVWRPFLQIRKAVLCEYLQRLGYSWREDESNKDVVFTRNRIRAQIIPAMEECSPEVVRTIARIASIIRDEDEYLSRIVEKWLVSYSAKGRFMFILTHPLQKEHPALQRRILRRYAESAGLMLDFLQTERLRALIHKKSGAWENLSGEWQALKTKDRLHFIRPQKEKNTEKSEAGVLSFDTEPIKVPSYSQPIPRAQMNGLQLRVRKTGDYIQPFGMQGTKPLKEYMIDRGIDRPFRDDWPIVCRGNEVLWVVGVGASEKLRVDKSDAACQMIFSGELPDYI